MNDRMLEGEPLGSLGEVGQNRLVRKGPPVSEERRRRFEADAAAAKRDAGVED